MMRSSIRFALAAMLCASLLARAAEEELDVKPAMAAAEAWLALVDAGRFGASWEEAAPIMRDAIEKTRWEMLVDGVRAPLGVANKRKLRSATFARQLPGAPAGEYFVIQYDTSFETRALTTEIVTPMRQPDGTWKVSGYLIR